MILSSINFIVSTLVGLFNGAAESKTDLPVGGQAVIGGVLMKGPDHWGMAVRRPDGKIWRSRWPSMGWNKMTPWKYPVLRGVVTMVEMLKEGFKALSKSAEISLGEEEELTTKDIVLSVIISIVAVIGLFVALPMWLGDLAASIYGWGDMAKNIVEGIARGLVFVVYVAVIGLWSDIEEVLRYHGAEHKTINAFEAGSIMTPDKISDYSRIHPRCGTSFLVIVVVMSIIVFSFIGHGGIMWRLGSRVILLPLVVGLSYEFIRAAARWGKVGRALMAPALSLQYLTTRQPNKSQLAVAMRSLEAALNVTFSKERPGREEYCELKR